MRHLSTVQQLRLLGRERITFFVGDFATLQAFSKHGAVIEHTER